MKVKKSVVEAMVRQVFLEHLGGLVEAPPGLTDADKDKKKAPEKKDAKSPPSAPKVKKDPKGPDQGKGPDDVPPPEEELPAPEDDEADSELSQDVSTDDEVEDAEEVTGGNISDQIVGKTIQSITMEPKSKTLPGAQEIVVTFGDIPDPLKILITKTGQVKFFFKSLHNEL